MTLEEIGSQPECWRRAQGQAADETDRLPKRGERVLVLGCGTSFFVASAYAWLREQAGHGETDAVIASELPQVVRRYDRIVPISRSGTTTEVLEALDRLDDDVRVTAVVGDVDTPLARRADDVIDLGYADEQSVVQTRFPTTLLVLLRTHLGESDVRQQELVSRGQAALDAPLRFARPGQLVVLGSGWAAPLADEAALKCRESVGMWAESYACGEYLHGPVSVAGPETLVWALTPLTRIQTDTITGTGARIHHGGDEPLAELVGIQRHAVEWAAASGRDADVPPHLTRSVVLR
jgi:fructoselysine-6-P-deglycase FrlB-like protein